VTVTMVAVSPLARLRSRADAASTVLTRTSAVERPRIQKLRS
jgi:hypothetical protein